MKQHSFGLFAFALALTVTAGLCSTASRAAETRVSVGVTETMETFNPYGDSVALMYGVWCQVLGCLGTYDFDKGQYVGTIAERWEVKDPNNWIFHVRKGMKFHNGTRVTAHDIVHSIGRTRKDPLSKQTIIVAAVASEKALDDYTVQLTTKIPTAPLLNYLFDLLIITSKDLYDKYGPEVADRQYPIGAGPYKFRELIPGQRLVIGKDKTHPMWKQYPQAPDEIVFRIMREPEQRVTAHNGQAPTLKLSVFCPCPWPNKPQEPPSTVELGACFCWAFTDFSGSGDDQSANGIQEVEGSIPFGPPSFTPEAAGEASGDRLAWLDFLA